MRLIRPERAGRAVGLPVIASVGPALRPPWPRYAHATVRAPRGHVARPVAIAHRTVRYWPRVSDRPARSRSSVVCPRASSDASTRYSTSKSRRPRRASGGGGLTRSTSNDVVVPFAVGPGHPRAGGGDVRATRSCEHDTEAKVAPSMGAADADVVVRRAHGHPVGGLPIHILYWRAGSAVGRGGRGVGDGTRRTGTR